MGVFGKGMDGLLDVAWVLWWIKEKGWKEGSWRLVIAFTCNELYF